MTKKLLEIRNKAKARKPSFIRHDAHKKKRAGNPVWRRPKGRQNKMRLHKKGYARARSTGFGSPKAVYGLSQEGLKQIVVNNLAELSLLDPKTDGAIISRAVGDKKRAELLNLAKEKNITVLNITHDAFQKRLEESAATKKLHQKEVAKRKDTKEKAAKKKETKKEEKKAEPAKEDNKEETSQEEAKLQEKKEHDKILTKKGDSL